MRYEVEVRNGVCVTRLIGRFVTGSDAVLEAVETQLQESGVNKAVLDLSEVPYVDSTGLAFVVELHKSLKRKGGRLVLAGPNARVREVLSLTRIDAIVPVFDCLESAEIALHGRGAAAALQGGVLC